jgi:ATP-binding cassette subfamily F protein 1
MIPIINLAMASKLNKLHKSGNTERTAPPEAARKVRSKADDLSDATPQPNLPESHRKTKSTKVETLEPSILPTDTKQSKSKKSDKKQPKQSEKSEKCLVESSNSKLDTLVVSKSPNPEIASILSGTATNTSTVEKADFANLVSERIVFTKTTIGISSFDLYVPGKTLLTSAQLTMSPGMKYGLIGANGSGKSTLLKKLLFLREGNGSKDSMQIDTLYVEQEFDADLTSTPIDIVLGSNYKLCKYQQEIKRIEDLFDVLTGEEEEFEALQIKHSELYDYVNAWNEDKERASVNKILTGLGFTESDLTRQFSHFSGGWRMRISLARSLYLEPDLLLLDEPTNHLDFEAIIWLSNYLQSWKGTVIVVSHNIGFINDVCDWIIAIESQKLSQYKGNYDSYKRAHQIKMREAEKAWESWDKKFKDLKKKGIKDKLEEHVKSTVSRPPKPFDGLIEFGKPDKLRGNIITMDNVGFSYSSDKPVLENVTFGIDSDSKIVLVGPNGSGKSTLVKLMTREISPTTGNIVFNPHARIGYYNQHFEAQLPLDQSPIDYLRSQIPIDFVGPGGSEQSVRSFLGRVRLEPSAHKKLIGELSGGQKARVAIVQLVFMRPNCLILDEPTNHLDIETVEALIDGLREYIGGVVIITHDHNLIEAIDARVIMMDPATKCINTKIESYDAYCNFVLGA